MTTNEVPQSKVGGAYAWYALGVMFIVYALNFIDRQILSILAEDIEASLALTDTQLGYLYGTAFALFYALFGIPLGRLADSWYRGRLMALGLAAWSTMTAASGLAGSFAQLATFRVGVGIGEAAASPAAFSMLADMFPKQRQALAMSVYSAGLYFGMGLSLPIGGWLSSHWDRTYASGGAPYDLVGWQAAFLAIGLPGLLVALWVWSLREPLRGAADGRPSPVVQPGAWRAFGGELVAILPPLTLWSVSRFPVALRTNLLALQHVGRLDGRRVSGFRVAAHARHGRCNLSARGDDARIGARPLLHWQGRDGHGVVADRRVQFVRGGAAHTVLTLDRQPAHGAAGDDEGRAGAGGGRAALSRLFPQRRT